MRRNFFGFAGLCGLAWGWLGGVATAQIVVEGVEDRRVYGDAASFRVPTEGGFDYAVEFNEVPVALDAPVDVDRPDYYELSVRRTHRDTGAEESLLVRFIVRSRARGNSEWGLPPWVTYPDIESAAGELAGAELRLVAPPLLPR
ncbi:MAG: hypothetical protein O7J95_18250, partial [Planctomycetota bacterium]|nr:hypothetical protein [Planctomycetota bacterium]